MKKFLSLIFLNFILLGSLPIFSIEILRQPVVNSFLNSVSFAEFPTILDEDGYRELEVDTVIKQLDHTQTPFGHWALQKFLDPLKNKKEILRRQNSIKFLVENSDILADFQQQFKILSNNSRYIIDYWDFRMVDYGLLWGTAPVSNSEIHRSAEDFYFSFFGLAPKSFTDYLNTNPTILSSAHLFNTGKSIFFLGLSAFYTAYNQEKHLSSATHHQFAWQHAFTNVFLAPLRKLYWHHCIYPNGYVDDAEKTPHTAFSLMSFADLCTFYNKKENTSTILAGLYASQSATAAACQIGLCCYYLLSQAKYFNTVGSSIKALQMNMVSVATFLNIAQTSIEQAVAHGLIEEPKNCLEASVSISEKLKKLFDLFKTPTLQTTSLVIHQGRILAAHRLMKEIKQELIPLLQTVGELDLYCMLAQQVQSQKLCLVDFIEDEAAFIHLKKYNNILLPVHKAVPNDIYLGKGCAHNIIFSGPLGSGKSVIIKGILLNIILAQSFGIAAAQSAQVSLFDKINIYLNVRDNIGNELSTGMAEYKKLQEIIDTITTLPGDQKCLTYIDEALKGTFGEDGAEALHEMGQTIAGKTNSIALIATHYQKPTELEQTTHGHFANCHLEILEPVPGIFERTFKIRTGINSWWFTDAEKRKRYRTWIMQLDQFKTTKLNT